MKDFRIFSTYLLRAKLRTPRLWVSQNYVMRQEMYAGDTTEQISEKFKSKCSGGKNNHWNFNTLKRE